MSGSSYTWWIKGEAAVAYLGHKKRQQEILFRAFENLAIHPQQEPLSAFQDPDGCPVRLQQFDEFLIMYFVDDAVKRVLILDISEVA